MSHLVSIDWPGLGVFSLEVFVVALLVLCLCGHFPATQRQPEFNAPFGRLLLAASVVSRAASGICAVVFALRRLPISWAVIAAGLTLLAAPLFLQRLSDRFVDGRLGLVVLGTLAAMLAYVSVRI